jgi:glycosyltransferase involved in cell wall biosynthesis
MRVLLINQFFYPDAAATGQLATDLGRALAGCGVRVDAICAASRYAGADAADPPPINIHRVPALPFARGAAGRVFSYASFYAGALWRAWRVPRPDVVVTLTTPPLLGLLGTLLKRTRGAAHCMWEMDLYPEVAVDLGALRGNSPLTRALRSLAGLSRRRADRVIALGECMRRRLIDAGCPAEKIQVIENWADGAEIQPLPFPDGPFTVLYSGNFGRAHDVETIRGAVEGLANRAGLRFLFAGGGVHHKTLETMCRERGIANAEFRDYAPRHGLAESLGQGHVGLVSQREETLGSVVMSKTYGLMAAGRGVIFVGPRGSTTAGIVERHGCGWRIDAGDTPALTRLLEGLSSEPELAREAGRRARRAFLEHYDRSVAVARFRRALGVEAAAPAAAGSVET